MMMKAVFGAVVVAVCLTQVAALECYSCEDCGLSGVLSIFETKVTCRASDFDIFGAFDPRCIKEVAGDGTVRRGCGTASMCLATSLLVRCSSADDTNCIICCDTDSCNGALNVQAAWMAIVLALAAAILATHF